MNLAEVQSDAANRLFASPSLAAFGKARLYSHFTKNEENASEIGKTLREKKVCLEIGLVEADAVPGAQQRTPVATAKFEVLAAESVKEEDAHAPTDAVLVLEIIRAMTARIDAYDTPPQFTSYRSAVSEQGYVLHVIGFSVPVILPR